MKKRSDHTAKRALSTLPLIGAAVTPATMADAKPAAPSSAATQKSAAPKLPVAPRFKDTNVVGIKELSLNPALPRAGEPVTVTFKIVNESDAPLKNIEWKTSGVLAETGMVESIGAHGSQTVTLKTTAPRGAFLIGAELDPLGKVAEPLPLRRNNKLTLKSVARITNTVWDGWASKAAARIGNMLDAAKLKTSVVGTINGPTLTVNTLKVAPLDTAFMKQLLIGDGVPNDVAEAFVAAFAQTYTDFASKYHALVPFAYPAFAAFPGPIAPPTPNIPFVLAIGTNADTVHALAANTIDALLMAKLSATRKAEPGASDAVERYALVLSGRLETWLACQQVSQVLGGGPVPTFAPPYVPVGPVVMGTTVPALSHLF